MENELPLISVIVPVYKVEQYLDECVSSIVNQTYKNLEIILIDDGSPDNCPKICDEWARKDDRIIVIHQENKGLSGARNAGLDIMKGDYVSFVDSDDVIHFRCIEILLHQLFNNYADISIGDFRKYSSNDFINLENEINGDTCVYSNYEIQHQYFNKNVNAARYVSACWKLYKRELFYDIRFPEKRLFEDEYVTYKIFDKANKIVEIDVSLYFYFINNNGITQTLTLDKRFDEYDAQIEKIEYYESKKYYDLYKEALREFLRTAQWDLIDCYKNTTKCDKNKKKKFIKQYKKVFNTALINKYLSFIDDYDYFILGNPKLTLFYRLKRWLKLNS